MRVLVWILVLCVGGYVFSHVQMAGHFPGLSPAVPTARHASEDAGHYYLTAAEIIAVQQTMQQSVNTRQFKDATLADGTVVHIFYDGYGPNMKIRLAKKIRVLSGDGTIVGDEVNWP